MPIQTDTLNHGLYDLLTVRYDDVTPLDSKEKTTSPEEADIFRFTFEKDGEIYGKVYVTIDNSRNLILYYGDEVGDSPDTNTSGTEFSDSWSSFRNMLKQWSQRKQLDFELKNKNHLAKDMAQRTYNKEKENLGESYYPMGKRGSYSDAVPNVKIIIQHTRQIGEGEKRYRNIDKIFVENTMGERFAVPSNKPGIAKVYARHIAEGGSPYDDKGRHITSLVEEYTKMAGFVRATKNKQFNESTIMLIQEGVNHYQSLRETLSRMIGRRGYNAYFEAWQPILSEEITEEANLNELFVQETIDPRIESVMPILSKLYKKVSEMKEINQLEAWADNIINEYKQGDDSGYIQLLQSKLKAGKPLTVQEKEKLKAYIAIKNLGLKEGDGGQTSSNPMGIPEEELDEGKGAIRKFLAGLGIMGALGAYISSEDEAILQKMAVKYDQAQTPQERAQIKRDIERVTKGSLVKEEGVAEGKFFDSDYLFAKDGNKWKETIAGGTGTKEDPYTSKFNGEFRTLAVLMRSLALQMAGKDPSAPSQFGPTPNKVYYKFNNKLFMGDGTNKIMSVEGPSHHEGVAEGLSEARNSLFAFVKQQFPTWPDYVLKDFLYQQAKGGIRDQAELDDFLKTNKQDFGNCKWTLTKLPITFDIFTPKTQRMLASREGGSSNPFQVPRDAERHAQQSQMIQQKGVSAEPIIVAKLSNGYDLIEGWHRTIQHLKAFPQGYTGPAWVCTGATYKSESVEQGVAEAYPNQQAARYNPNGTTYKGSHNKMPILDPDDPVHNADRYGLAYDEPYEMDFDKEDLKRAIAKGMSDLPDTAKRVLELRFWEDMTYEKVASELGLSKERIRQIEAKALRQLRHPSRSDRLRPFVHPEMAEDLDANQKRVGQLGPYEKVGPQGAVGKLVGAEESIREGQEDLDTIRRLLGEGLAGELIGGTVGGTAGALAGSALGALAGGPVGAKIGGVVGGAAGGTAGQMMGRDSAEDNKLSEAQLNEFAAIIPAIAAGARVLLPLLSRAGPALGRMASTAGKAGAQVAGKAATGVGKGALELGKSAAQSTAQNAGKVGLGAGVYSIADEIGKSIPQGLNKVYTDATSAASALTTILGNAVDGKTIGELAIAAAKYAIPLGMLLAVLYGGKKLIDQVMSEGEDDSWMGSIGQTIGSITPNPADLVKGFNKTFEGQEDLDTIKRLLGK